MKEVVIQRLPSRQGTDMSNEGRRKVLEECIRLDTERLKTLKEEIEVRKKGMANIVDCLERDKKALKELEGG